MDRAPFDAICAALPGATHVVQWGGSSVWKVSGKVFAVGGGGASGGEEDGVFRVTLKPSEMGAEIWRGAPGVRPAPYLGRAGWIQIDDGAMSDEEFADMIAASHAVVAAKLTRAARKAAGIA